MTITNINPTANSVVAPGDSISFDIPSGYASLIIKANQSAGDEYVYDTGNGGAQVGYTATVTDIGGGVNRFTLSRAAGWDKDPTLFTVTEDAATTTFSFYLTSTATYPEGMQPYNDKYEGSLKVSEGDAEVRGDVGWVDFDKDTFNVFDKGNGKVQVAGVSAPDPTAVHTDGSNELTPLTAKDSPASADVLVIEDSAAGYAKKKVLISKLPTGNDADAIHDNVANEVSVLTEKSNVVDSDLFLIEDSAAGYVKKKVKATNLPSSPDATAVHTDGSNELSVLVAKDSPANNDVLVIEDSAAGYGKKKVLISKLPSSSGDVTGPASSVDNRVALFSGVTGKILKDSSSVTEAAGIITNASATATQRLKEKAAAAATLAAHGDFWVRDDAPCVPMFTDDAGQDIRLGKQVAVFHDAGRWTGNAGTWVSSDAQSLFSVSNMADTLGSGADPAFSTNGNGWGGYLVPKAGKISDIYLQYGHSAGTIDGDVALYKFTTTEGSAIANPTGVLLGSKQTLTGATAWATYKLSQTGLADSVAAGDILLVCYKSVAFTGSVIFNLSAVIEFD